MDMMEAGQRILESMNYRFCGLDDEGLGESEAWVGWKREVWMSKVRLCRHKSRANQRRAVLDEARRLVPANGLIRCGCDC